MSVDAHRGTRLRGERDKLGLSQADMAAQVGVRREMWSRYEAGTEPGATVLAAAAKAGVDVLYVLTGRREVSTPGAHTLPHDHGGSGASAQPNVNVLGTMEDPVRYETAAWVWAAGSGVETREYHVIPNITERVCAGRPAGAAGDRSGADHTRAGVLAFERDFMRRVLGSDEDRYMTLAVEGDSMSPTLLDGDLVAIDVSISRINVSGIYVLRFGNELTIKRVMRKSDGAVVVASDNRAYAQADESFTAPAAESLNVVGRMVWPRVR